VPLDDQHVGPVAGQDGRGGQARDAGADHDDVGDGKAVLRIRAYAHDLIDVARDGPAPPLWNQGTLAYV
jgi:hypothetical protein